MPATGAHAWRRRSNLQLLPAAAGGMGAPRWRCACSARLCAPFVQGSWAVRVPRMQQLCCSAAGCAGGQLERTNQLAEGHTMAVRDAGPAHQTVNLDVLKQ